MAHITDNVDADWLLGRVPSQIEQECLKLAATQHWLLTRAQALEVGLSRYALDRRIRSGLLVPLYSRVYRVAAAPRSWHQGILAACKWTSGVASHRSALRLLGIEGFSGDIIEVTSTGSRRSSTRTVCIHHRREMPSCDVMMVGPVPTTTPTRTLLEVGSVLRPYRLEEALDSALRQRLTSIGKLREGITRLGGRGRRGPGALAKLLDARDSGTAPTESTIETRLVRLLRRHRLPPPSRQVPVSDERGLIGRLDFAYPEHRIAIEMQSYRWHSSRAAWHRDMERLNRLQEVGWIVIQVTFEDLERRPSEVARRIGMALQARSQGTS